jgi:hypothetical protein
MPRTKKVVETGMKSIKLPLTDTQMRKLAKGQGIRVNPKAGCTAYEMWCDAGKCKKMEKAMMKGKGFAMKFSPEEMDENVETEGGRINFKKIGKTLRSTAKAVGKLYREKIRPVVGPKIREAVKKAITEGIPLAGQYLGAITGQPEIVAAAESPAVKRFAEKAAKSGTEKLSKLTGAFGMAGKGMCDTMGGAMVVDKTARKYLSKIEHPKIIPYRAQLQDNYSPFLNPKHPAMHPTLPMADNSLPLVGRGLFAGNGLFAATAGMGMMGSPMDPALPQIDNSTYTM